MNHDFESKQWADNHTVMSDGIDRLISRVAQAIRKFWAQTSETSFSLLNRGNRAPSGDEHAAACSSDPSDALFASKKPGCS